MSSEINNKPCALIRIPTSSMFLIQFLMLSKDFSIVTS